jgi:hypothetical protein
MYRLITSQFYRIKHRRRYREIVARKIRRNAKVVKSLTFSSSPAYTGKLLLVPSNIDDIEKCAKSGSWRKNNFWIGRPFRWTSTNRPYFYEARGEKYSIGADPFFMTGVQLEKLFNCEVIYDNRSSTSLNIYSGRINKTTSTPELETAIYLAISGAESFQHFIQDCMPLISLLKTITEIPETIPIILMQPQSSFLSIESYIAQMGINNPILFLSTSNCFRVKELFYLRFKPFNATYNIPPQLYQNSYRQFHYSFSAPKETNQVILLDRKEKIRTFGNISPLKEILQSWCEKNSLAFVSIQQIFSSAKFVFAIHGGANYNMIWAPSDATLIEFIPTDATDSLFHIVRSYGQTYLPYALRQNKGDISYEVSSSDLHSILQLLESETGYLDT